MLMYHISYNTTHRFAFSLLICDTQVLNIFAAPELASKAALQIVRFEVLFKLLSVMRRVGDRARVIRSLEYDHWMPYH